MRTLMALCACWLLCACAATPLPPAPPTPPAAATDGGSCPGDAGNAGVCGDPVVGRSCGPATFCPCGYLCFMGKCEVADFHPPCVDMS
jgi:hypothetical protein